MIAYARKFANYYRRIESVAEIGQQLRTLDLKDPVVQNAIFNAENATFLFSSALAKDYL